MSDRHVAASGCAVGAVHWNVTDELRATQLATLEQLDPHRKVYEIKLTAKSSTSDDDVTSVTRVINVDGEPGKQVAQLSLTNPRDALHHDKRQNFKTVTTITPLLLVICHPLSRIDIAYSCTKFDDFAFSRSSNMIKTPKIFNGSHDLSTPQSGTVCRPWAHSTFTSNL